MLIGLQVRCYLGDNEQRWFMWYSGNNTAGRPIDAVTPSSGSTGDHRVTCEQSLSEYLTSEVPAACQRLHACHTAPHLLPKIVLQHALLCVRPYRTLEIARSSQPLAYTNEPGNQHFSVALLQHLHAIVPSTVAVVLVDSAAVFAPMA